MHCRHILSSVAAVFFIHGAEAAPTTTTITEQEIASLLAGPDPAWIADPGNNAHLLDEWEAALDRHNLKANFTARYLADPAAYPYLPVSDDEMTASWKFFESLHLDPDMTHQASEFNLSSPNSTSSLEKRQTSTTNLLDLAVCKYYCQDRGHIDRNGDHDYNSVCVCKGLEDCQSSGHWPKGIKGRCPAEVPYQNLGEGPPRKEKDW
ncbi:hypothetical protein LTR64_005475 [Lithohypha guttulata]|uniref:uncharacterized protein n=1 Tax=Lithohypha guttulata TaxID=1690604 RepID=UPI00315D0DDB